MQTKESAGIIITHHTCVSVWVSYTVVFNKLWQCSAALEPVTSTQTLTMTPSVVRLSSKTMNFNKAGISIRVQLGNKGRVMNARSVRVGIRWLMSATSNENNNNRSPKTRWMIDATTPELLPAPLCTFHHLQPPPARLELALWSSAHTIEQHDGVSKEVVKRAFMSSCPFNIYIAINSVDKALSKCAKIQDRTEVGSQRYTFNACTCLTFLSSPFRSQVLSI